MYMYICNKRARELHTVKHGFFVHIFFFLAIQQLVGSCPLAQFNSHEIIRVLPESPKVKKKIRNWEDSYVKRCIFYNLHKQTNSDMFQTKKMELKKNNIPSTFAKAHYTMKTLIQSVNSYAPSGRNRSNSKAGFYMTDLCPQSMSWVSATLSKHKVQASSITSNVFIRAIFWCLREKDANFKTK